MSQSLRIGVAGLGTVGAALVRMIGRRREALLASGLDVTVTAVSARWGFTHHGRFAAAYAARFGERPSDTLRASTGR